MEPRIEIRPFLASDQDAARTLILNGLGQHFGFIDETLNPDLDDILRSYVSAGHVFVVATCGGELVGTGGLIQEGESAVRLVRMSVSALVRRQGIGRSLVNHLEARAMQKGYRKLVLETNLQWHDAIGLYRSCGFIEYACDESQIHMEKSLINTCPRVVRRTSTGVE